MKKSFVIPTLETIRIESSSIICASVEFGGDGNGQRANAMSEYIFD